ncbi:MAG: hypothetical protein IKW99_08915 [Bacteroidales bacterium]|nr:hypothetical protein [Bacteroidales bacterium]
MRRLYLKALLFLGIIGGIIWAIDLSGMFNPDMENFHEKDQWDSFYKFTESNDVDVLLVGNSHLYTGINPNHLSCILGANCFILASPGTTITDSYYALKEGLSKCDPKVVVVETYGVSQTRIRELTGGELTSEFRSFSSRKSILRKLASMPFLFSIDNYLSALSASIRGHDMIFKDTELIKKNLDGKNTPFKPKSLNLGRFTRFTTGITDKTERLYDEEGAVVDGNKFRVNKENYQTVRRIERLCERRGIDLVFLTLPMYEKHVENYSSWQTIMSRVIGPGQKWLDLQSPYDHELFTRECFEDTRNSNQHMTAMGALIADYKLADYIIDEVKPELPDRSKSRDWRQMFYSEKGYFENYTIESVDNWNFLLCRNVDVMGILVKDCVFLPYGNGQAQVFMRVDKKTDIALLKDGLELFMRVVTEEGESRSRLVVRMTPGINPRGHYSLSSEMMEMSRPKSIELEYIDFP